MYNAVLKFYMARILQYNATVSKILHLLHINCSKTDNSKTNSYDAIIKSPIYYDLDCISIYIAVPYKAMMPAFVRYHSVSETLFLWSYLCIKRNISCIFD